MRPLQRSRKLVALVPVRHGHGRDSKPGSEEMSAVRVKELKELGTGAADVYEISYSSFRLCDFSKSKCRPDSRIENC